MTWRAFIIGLLGVIGLCYLTPINDYAVGNTFLTGNHFPAGVFFVVFVLVFLVNPLVKLLRAAWGDEQAASRNAVEVYVGYLRRKLDAVGAGDVLQTVRGHGYAVSVQDEQ